MANVINQFIDHKLICTPNYDRRVELDLPEEEFTLKRAALIALPFAKLYSPFRSTLSLTMGTCRTVTHMGGAYKTFQKGDYRHTAGHVTQIALAALALGLTLIKSKLGDVVTTSVDLCVGLSRIPTAPDEALQVLSSAIHLGIIFTGSLELIFISALLKGMISAVQVMLELEKERFPEALAKMAMGMIRYHQAYGHFQNIMERNALLASSDFLSELSSRAEKGKDAAHLISSPLADLEKSVEEKAVILSDATAKPINFGSYFHGFGKQLVKEMNLGARTKVIDGKEVIELDFKVNHVFRAKLESLITRLNETDPAQVQRLLELKHSHIKSIQYSPTFFPVGNQTIDSAHKIDLEGFGSLIVGSAPDCYTLYDRVLLQVDAKASIFSCHEALSLFGLDDALRVSSADDVERLKVGHLFRTLFPREATPFERTQEYFDLPIDQLKTRIGKMAPEMREGFSTYLNKMQAKELYPGKMRYAIQGIGKRAYDLGARGLIASITGTDSDEALFERIASMLKMGMISSEDRKSASMDAEGLSSYTDFFTGGADSVYTQMVTKEQIERRMLLDDFSYFAGSAILFSPDILDMGSYQYHDDSFGVRNTSSGSFGYGDYFKRESIFEFVQNRQNKLRNRFDWFGWYDANEVMFKERLKAETIRTIVFDDKRLKDGLLSYLRTKDLVQKDSFGAETILGTPIHKFIRVATHASEDLFSAV